MFATTLDEHGGFYDHQAQPATWIAQDADPHTPKARLLSLAENNKRFPGRFLGRYGWRRRPDGSRFCLARLRNGLAPGEQRGWQRAELTHRSRMTPGANPGRARA